MYPFFRPFQNQIFSTISVMGIQRGISLPASLILQKPYEKKTASTTLLVHGHTTSIIKCTYIILYVPRILYYMSHIISSRSRILPLKKQFISVRMCIWRRSFFYVSFSNKVNRKSTSFTLPFNNVK